MREFKITTQLPGGANWIAVDHDGVIWWYSDKPTYNFEDEIWDRSGNKGECGEAGFCAKPNDASKTLLKYNSKVGEYEKYT